MALAFLVYLHPAVFVGVDQHTKNLRMFSMVLFTVFFPAVSLFLAWRLKLIKSLALENRQDRLVGFIVTMFFYFWASYVFRNLPDIPQSPLISYLEPFWPSAAPGCARFFIKLACMR